MTRPLETQALVDLKLVREKRDEAAFSRLYDVYSPILYRVCLLILKSEAEAQDALQEVFFRLWEKPQAYDPSRGKLYTWLCLITRSRAIDRLRKNGRLNTKVTLSADGDLGSVPDPRRSTAPDALESALAGKQRAQVRRLLGSLPREQAVVLTLAYYEGLSQSEIAEKLKRPLGTVKTQMRSAMQNLSTQMTPEMKTWL